jgi:V8-like Glu-specific endopeptidase
MLSKKGDSGAPLLAQSLNQDLHVCFVIGIHISGRYNNEGDKVSDENSAVRITKEVIKRISQFEKEFNNSKVSSI